MHTEYLEAKRSIDDRSLNRHVWDAFVSRSSVLAGTLHRPLRIGELGAGSGTMVDRLREWHFFDGLSRAGCDRIEYHSWEQNPRTARYIPDRIAREARIVSSEVLVTDITDGGSAALVPPGGYDILIAHAVLDLFPPEVLSELLQRFLQPRGLLYGSIVFDGVTVFAPEGDPLVDRLVMEYYHRSMTAGGFGRTHLLNLTSRGFRVLSAGSSDWIVPPRKEGLREDERTLVATILSMVESSVGSLVDAEGEAPRAETALQRRDLEGWLGRRREQMERGELLFEAHQLDMLVER
jgi:hypothetical protein